MTALTPELLAELERKRRLSELELSKPGALTPGGFHARNAYTAAVIANADGLLAAARELHALKSALDHIQAHYVGCLEVREIDMRAPALLKMATELGWVDPFTTGDKS